MSRASFKVESVVEEVEECFTVSSVTNFLRYDYYGHQYAYYYPHHPQSFSSLFFHLKTPTLIPSLRLLPSFTRLLSFATPEEPASESRRRKRRLRIEPPLSFLRQPQQQRIPSKTPINPNAPKAYFSLPEGIATAAGLIAMMTDHYKILEGSDSEHESNDVARTSRRPQKRARGKYRLMSKGPDGPCPDLLQLQSASSSYACMSLLKSKRSGGSVKYSYK
ncbi:uncharacterized protein A4U43_C01F11700 [Asparagus officinalis]|uniref:Uncharacterized protein n=1 Tax=Asparagus officinalis TaxID=4686 RepID=A0A5P1FNV2_ASPOF|nr:uncharacterized protein A4U43_C01F11700 [Asparagus officinalis]